MSTLTYEAFATEVGRVLGMSPGELPPELDLYDGLGIDSLGLITIGDHIEQAFSIRIPAADVVTCRRLGEFHDLAQRLVLQEEQQPCQNP